MKHNFTQGAEGSDATETKSVLCDVHGTLIINDGQGNKVINQPLTDLLTQISNDFTIDIVIISAFPQGAREELEELGFDIEKFPNIIDKGGDSISDVKRNAILAFEDDSTQIRFNNILGIKTFHPDELDQAVAFIDTLKNTPTGPVFKIP